MAEWVIYYAGGPTFSSKDGHARNAPRDYVQVVMQETAAGRDVLEHHDHYCWHNDRWIPHDASGLAQYKNDPTIKEKVVLNGYWIADEAFWKLHNTALDHPEWKHLQIRFVRGRVCE